MSADSKMEAENEQAAKEGEILFPERDVVIDGETITVNEFTFGQSLKMERIAQPILEEISRFGDDWDSMDFLAVSRVFADNDEAFLQLIGAATGKDPKWIGSLPNKDGTALALTFYAVNSDFFVQRLVTVLIKQKMDQMKAAE